MDRKPPRKLLEHTSQQIRPLFCERPHSQWLWIVQEVVLACKAYVTLRSGEGVVVDWEDVRDALQLFEWIIVHSDVDLRYRRLYELLGDEGLPSWVLDQAGARRLTTDSVNLDGPGSVLDFDAIKSAHWPLNSVETAAIAESKLSLLLPEAAISTLVRIGSKFTSVPGKENYRKNSGRLSSIMRILSTLEASLVLQIAQISSKTQTQRHSMQLSRVKSAHCTRTLLEARDERPEFLRYPTAYRTWLEEELHLPHRPFYFRAPPLTPGTISLHHTLEPREIRKREGSQRRVKGLPAAFTTTHIQPNADGSPAILRCRTKSSFPDLPRFHGSTNTSGPEDTSEPEPPRAPGLYLPKLSWEPQLRSLANERASNSDEHTTEANIKDPPCCVVTPDENMFQTAMLNNISRAVSGFDSTPNIQGIGSSYRQPHLLVNLIESLKSL